MSASIVAADQFCGGGGTSTGLAQVCRERSLTPRLYALNHWPIALETHRRNHPLAIHVSEEMERLDPLEVVPEGYLDLLVASPTCTFFSIARGGKPTSDQLRSQPYEVVRWIQALHPAAVLVENVPEFRLWGPVTKAGLPDPARKGWTFRRWVGRIRNLGYNVDYRVLNAADYGGATSRRRFFLIARRGDEPVGWPVPTHAPRSRPEIGRAPWRAAAEVLDWSLTGESIWTRTRPLSFATWRRIVIGLERYGGPDVQPFVRALKKLTHLDAPGEAPRDGGPSFILPVLGRHARGGRANRPRPTDEPLPTLTASRGGDTRLVEPFIHYMEHGGAVASVKEPLRTITTAKGGAQGIIQPYIVRTNFDCERTQRRMGAAPRSTDEPMPTVLGSDRSLSLAEPFLVPVVGRRASHAVDPKSVRDPFPAFQTRTGIWLADAVIVPRHGERRGQAPRAHSVSEPMPVVPASGAGILARGFLLKYYGNGDNVESVEDPLPTLTTKDRCMLVRPIVIGDRFLDIRIRMIQPHELSAGMGFPRSYEFVGNRGEVVKQIGNAVEVNIARALCSSLLSEPKGTIESFQVAA